MTKQPRNKYLIVLKHEMLLFHFRFKANDRMLFAVMVNVVHLGKPLICLEFQKWQLFLPRPAAAISLNRNENIFFINFYGDASACAVAPT